MSASRPSGFTGLLKQRLTGLAFLLVIAGLVALTIAIYQKVFIPVVEVSLKTDRIGNQLSAPTDVKLRGLIVGEVRKVSSNGAEATVDLALDPDQVKLIPADVQAQLLPKTLFGEKFVSLVIPEGADDTPIKEGDVITQDRSETARETETALNNLLPLLQTLKPQQLSMTLNALSTALRGRGDQIGENLVIVDSYLKEFNPELGRLEANNRGLADYADILTEAAPDILRVLDNLSFVNRSLVDQEDELNGFLTTTTGFTGEMASFLEENEDRFITLAAESVGPLQTLARYSPEFPCLAEGLTESNGFIGDSFGGLQPGLHITLEFVPQNGGYRPGDEPFFGEDAGPTCFGLDGPPIRPFPVTVEVTDGYCDEQEEQSPGISQECEGRGGGPAPPSGEQAAARQALTDPSRALARRDVERAQVGAAVGPVLGMPPSDVPDLAVLLFGPVARGTTVGLSAG